MTKNSNQNYRIANSVHKLFCSLTKPAIKRLGKQANRLAYSHGLTYTDDDGKTTVINVTLRPRIISAPIEKALWGDLQVLDRAFYRVASLYFRDPDLYELFPFEEKERDWLACIQEPSYIPGRIATRWDANTTFADQDLKEGFSFFEVNGVGVGGMWYGAAAGELALKTVVPALRKLDPRFHPRPTKHMGLLLLDLINSQRKKLGRTRGTIGLVMEKASGSNFVEFERLAHLYSKRGFTAVVLEPWDLYFAKDELYGKNKIIDMVYRDTTLSELSRFDEKGFDLLGLRKGFARGQIVSSLEGEFDHKSAFEVFTNSKYAKYFTAKERALFKRHILWTRLLKERKTTNAKDQTIDLIPFVLKNQSMLVLKPNRLYGGKGIVFGTSVDGRSWRRKIESALYKPGDWVIQALGALRKKTFFSPLGAKFGNKDFYVVSGFFSTEKGLGMVGRMSERKIVNVAQRGGLTPILLL